MIKAILLDLDNTLLHNADRVFAPEYMQLADHYFEQRWGYKPVSAVMVQMIRIVTGVHDFQLTNTATAISLIADATGQSLEEIQAGFDDFYREVYPQLQRCVEPNPTTAGLFDYLRQKDYALVIATNSLYSAEAIRQRLVWAGLPDQSDTYALVTNSDNMHFAKPDPAYYAEIIARVGVEPDEAIMVGDNPINDLIPAQRIGLHTYHVTDYYDGSPFEQADSSGSLGNFLQMISQSTWLDTLIPHPLQPEAIEPEMRGNLGALFGLLAEVKAHQWQQHPDPEEWSIIQIVCHLLESEIKVQQPRLRRILAEDNPFLVNPQPPPGPHAARPCDKSGLHAAQRFMQARLETLDWLAQLNSEDWQRPARHSIFGVTSLLEMAHFTAQHDRLHLNQLCQTLGRCD